VVTDANLPSELLPRLLDKLVKKSILVREDTPVGPRFRQLQSIREYGLHKIADQAALEHLEQRHLAHYRTEAVTAAREMFGPSGVAWFRRLSAEHDDFRAALEGCAAPGGPVEDGAVIVAALQHYWVMTGRFAEGRHWAGRLLGRTSPTMAGH